MVHKSDKGKPAYPTFGTNNKDLEDAVTTEVVPETAALDAVSARRKGDSAAVNDEAPAANEDTVAPGTLLRDRFEIVALVHSGGMGHVYKAIDTRRHAIDSEHVYVAIKMLRRSIAERVDARLALEREAARAQRLSHPNIISIYDFDEHDGQFFLVMEWLDGESVNDLLRRTSGKRLAPEFARRVIRGVAAAVQHAHRHGIVHADINPSNVFVTDTQEIKLLDFGVARHHEDDHDDGEASSLWVTKPYASPEVLSGEAPAVEDDIFSLGCIAYRLLGGRHPYSGRTSLEARESGTVLHPITGLGEGEWQTLRRALSFSRSDRPGSADAFLGEAPASAPAPAPAAAVFTHRPGIDALAKWQVWLPSAAAVLIGVAWWVSQGGVGDAPDEQPTAVDATPAVETPAAPDPAEQLLGRAADAMAAARYVEPVDDNARAIFREILAVDPTNAAALAGLREISDVFVQRANEALAGDAPEAAAAALAVAAETDPDNPAVVVASELLLAQANALLADARSAAADGDTDRATALLAQAESYDQVEASEIEAVRELIAASIREQSLLAGLAAAETHMANNRLTVPAGNNARDLLGELTREHGPDPRLVAARERLGALLLARAALATADGRYADADASLDGLQSLGVMTSELADARASLERAREAAAVAAAAPAPAETGTAADDAAGVAGAIAAAGIAAGAQAASADAPAPAPAVSGAPNDARGASNAAGNPAAEGDRTPTAAAAGAPAGSLEPDGMDAATQTAVAGADVAPADTTPTEPQPGRGATDESAGPGLVATAATAAAATAMSAMDGESASSAAAAAEQRTGTGETGALPDLPTPDEGSSPAAVEPEAAAAKTSEPPAKREVKSLSELQIEEYVPPQYPRGAWNRGQTGFVELRFNVHADGSTGEIEVVRAEPGDVFISSAAEAVSKWRFAQRNEELTAQVTLRFEQ